MSPIELFQNRTEQIRTTYFMLQVAVLTVNVLWETLPIVHDVKPNLELVLVNIEDYRFFSVKFRFLFHRMNLKSCICTSDEVTGERSIFGVHKCSFRGGGVAQ